MGRRRGGVLTSPLAAFAGFGAEASKPWLQPLQGTRRVEDVGAEARAAEQHGQRRPVQVPTAAAPSRSRAEVEAGLGRYVVRRFGA
jgi:hypothetical protein